MGGREGERAGTENLENALAVGSSEAAVKRAGHRRGNGRLIREPFRSAGSRKQQTGAKELWPF